MDEPATHSHGHRRRTRAASIRNEGRNRLRIWAGTSVGRPSQHGAGDTGGRPRPRRRAGPPACGRCRRGATPDPARAATGAPLPPPPSLPRPSPRCLRQGVRAGPGPPDRAFGNSGDRERRPETPPCRAGRRPPGAPSARIPSRPAPAPVDPMAGAGAGQDRGVTRGLGIMGTRGRRSMAMIGRPTRPAAGAGTRRGATGPGSGPPAVRHRAGGGHPFGPRRARGIARQQPAGRSRAPAGRPGRRRRPPGPRTGGASSATLVRGGVGSAAGAFGPGQL